MICKVKEKCKAEKVFPVHHIFSFSIHFSTVICNNTRECSTFHRVVQAYFQLQSDGKTYILSASTTFSGF